MREHELKELEENVSFLKAIYTPLAWMMWGGSILLLIYILILSL